MSLPNLVRTGVVVDAVEGLAVADVQAPAVMVCSRAWISMVPCAGLSTGLLDTSPAETGLASSKVHAREFATPATA